jgi:hypothetical protein
LNQHRLHQNNHLLRRRQVVQLLYCRQHRLHRLFLLLLCLLLRLEFAIRLFRRLQLLA